MCFAMANKASVRKFDFFLFKIRRQLCSFNWPTLMKTARVAYIIVLYKKEKTFVIVYVYR